jgi:hypothetical protein
MPEGLCFPEREQKSVPCCPARIRFSSSLLNHVLDRKTTLKLNGSQMGRAGSEQHHIPGLSDHAGSTISCGAKEILSNSIGGGSTSYYVHMKTRCYVRWAFFAALLLLFPVIAPAQKTPELPPHLFTDWGVGGEPGDRWLIAMATFGEFSMLQDADPSTHMLGSMWVQIYAKRNATDKTRQVHLSLTPPGHMSRNVECFDDEKIYLQVNQEPSIEVRVYCVNPGGSVNWDRTGYLPAFDIGVELLERLLTASELRIRVVLPDDHPVAQGCLPESKFLGRFKVGKFYEQAYKAFLSDISTQQQPAAWPFKQLFVWDTQEPLKFKP